MVGLVMAALLAALPLRGIVELDSSFGVTDAQYQALGADYPSVGEFLGVQDSGVLIRSDWVLTAAHVAAGLTIGTSDFAVGGTNYTVENIIINPAYNGTNLDADIALVELSGNVNNVTPATLYTGSSELGVTGTWVGFGVGGNGTTGQLGPRGTLRGATNVIDALYDPVSGNLSLTSGSAIVADFDDGTIANNTLDDPPIFSSPIPTSLEGSLAAGDSGGGVFATISGTMYLIGVNDFNAPGNFGDNTQYGALSGAQRVSTYADWVVSEIPEPGSAAAMAGVLAVLPAMARRWRLRR
jgi:secreted trypsin-like serine protease